MLGDAIWIGLGAAAGANLRYVVNRGVARFVSASVPLGTLVVNVTGSLLLGFLLAWTSERVLADPRWRLLLAVGFCSSYTTFSSYTYETFTLFEQGHVGLAAANFALNNLVCLAAVLGGVAVARMV